jgi:tRNA modification GTPase
MSAADDTAGETTVCACATATGGMIAIIRLSGPRAFSIAEHAGLPTSAPWRIQHAEWLLPAGDCPISLLTARGPKSFTGFDSVEITLPGSADLVALALEQLIAHGAEMAAPGAFARQALSNGRLSLDRAQAILAITHASSAAAAEAAIARLRTSLSSELTAMRERIIYLRALVEAGLDFVEEDDVRAYEPRAMQQQLFSMHEQLQRWLTVADTDQGIPVVCLVGPANAGKSALFNRLTHGQALVSPIAGTTRDWLDGTWIINDRSVRLIDTAGWLDHASGLDAAGVHAGQQLIHAASVVLACSAPDAAIHDERLLPPTAIRIATKSDLGGRDQAAHLHLSAQTGDGIAALTALVDERLQHISSGDPRQQRLLNSADTVLKRLGQQLPGDELLADDLRNIADYLGDLLGITTPDDVLNAIFSKFCIGK